MGSSGSHLRRCSWPPTSWAASSPSTAAAFGSDVGEIHYFAPDTLSWTPLGLGHSAWVVRVLGGPLDDFYDGLRWPGWQGEVEDVRPDEAISCYPFLFTEQGRDPAATTRRLVPWEELRGVLAGAADQLADVDDGTSVRIRLDGNPKS